MAGLWKMATAMLNAWKHESGWAYLTLQWPSGALHAWKTLCPPALAPLAFTHSSTTPPGATLAVPLSTNICSTRPAL